MVQLIQVVCWVILNAYLSSAYYFQNELFSINSFRNTIRGSNSYDPDQAGHFVGLDSGLNYLQSLSADDKSHHQQEEI